MMKFFQPSELFSNALHALIALPFGLGCLAIAMRILTIVA
jgi:hypothetical protein